MVQKCASANVLAGLAEFVELSLQQYENKAQAWDYLMLQYEKMITSDDEIKATELVDDLCYTYHYIYRQGK